jgi:hypothetical protein
MPPRCPWSSGLANEEMVVLRRLLKEIDDLKLGLEPAVLAGWYEKIATDARSCAPGHLTASISVVQDQILPMKFEFKSSKRAVPYVLDAIDRNLTGMPMATRLYFQKLSEVIQQETLR